MLKGMLSVRTNGGIWSRRTVAASFCTAVALLGAGCSSGSDSDDREISDRETSAPKSETEKPAVFNEKCGQALTSVEGVEIDDSFDGNFSASKPEDIGTENSNDGSQAASYGTSTIFDDLEETIAVTATKPEPYTSSNVATLYFTHDGLYRGELKDQFPDCSVYQTRVTVKNRSDSAEKWQGPWIKIWADETPVLYGVHDETNGAEYLTPESQTVGPGEVFEYVRLFVAPNDGPFYVMAGSPGDATIMFR